MAPGAVVRPGRAFGGTLGAPLDARWPGGLIMKYPARCLPLLLAVLAIAACSDPRRDLDAAESRHTPAAFREFLAKYPDDPLAAQARARLETLRFEEASAARTRQACKAFLAEFPAGAHRDAVLGLDETLAFEDADRQGGAAAWQRLLGEFPRGAHRRQAVRRLQKEWGKGEWRLAQMRWDAGRPGANAVSAPDGAVTYMPEGSKLRLKFTSSVPGAAPLEIQAKFVHLRSPTAYFRDESGRWIAWITNSPMLIPLRGADESPFDPASVTDAGARAIAQWRNTEDENFAAQIESMDAQAAASPRMIKLLGTLPTPEAHTVLAALAQHVDPEIAAQARQALLDWNQADALLSRAP
ncbi:MAG: hypothetical protein U1F30_10555 [Steroidobacteraceae bacterium]